MPVVVSHNTFYELVLQSLLCSKVQSDNRNAQVAQELLKFLLEKLNGEYINLIYVCICMNICDI